MTQPLEVVLASANTHKIRELQELADQAGVAVVLRSARDLGGMPSVQEDTGTFVGNARKKARALHEVAQPGTWVMADDSGICVDALDGGPGVESAYFAGPEGDDDRNLKKLVEVMTEIPGPQRGAHYLCLLLVIDGEGREQVFEGRCEGTLAYTPSGGGGFGYDPLFIPTGYTDTFGILPAATKQALSHRAKAWLAFCEWLKTAG